LQGYQRAELITQEELAFIKKVDRQPKARVEALLLSEGRTYALLYLSLLKKLQRVDPIQCLLVLITDALQGIWSLHTFLFPTSDTIQDHDERIPLFLRAIETDPDLPYVPLLRCI
jgi:V-type H+-transporting ATPase subunit H